ncbi:MAG: hypothetical protein Rubg2KO_09330 [Rubricoccaceae bacterium]
MRRIALIALLSVASACSAPRVVSETPDYLLAEQYRVLPAAPTGEPIAEAVPAIPTGDAALDRFLAELAAALDRQDWRGVVARFESESYAEQWALINESRQDPEGSAVQVLAETLGMQTILRPFGTLETTLLERLDRIRVVTLRDVSPSASGTVRVSGDVRLDDNTRLPLDFSLQPMGDTYAVVVPMG